MHDIYHAYTMYIKNFKQNIQKFCMGYTLYMSSICQVIFLYMHDIYCVYYVYQ
jgi:hypothetical protein